DDPNSGASNFGEVQGDLLVVSNKDIKRITAESSGGKNIKAFENIKRVQVKGVTVSLPKGLRIKAIGKNEIYIPGFCFVAGTSVRLADKTTKNIESIRLGDKVVSYHHECGGNHEAEVTELFRKEANRLIRVVIEDEQFLSTPEHPYYANGRYIEAAALQAGDSVLTMDGAYGVINTVASMDTLVVVYNFSVAENHNYYIGQSGYLVHNDCKLATKIMDAVDKQNDPKLKTKLADYYTTSMKQTKSERTNLNAQVSKLRSNEKIAGFISDFGSSRELKSFFEDPVLAKSWGIFGKSPLRKSLKYLENVKGLSSTWYIQYKGSTTKLYHKNRRELATFTSKEVIADGGSSSNWNGFLSRKLMPNHVYKVDNYTYYTDGYARVSSVTGMLKNITRGRLDYQQGISVSLKDGTPGEDDGGHLIANILYGPGEQINYVPQRVNLNRGAYRAMEGRWKKALDQDKSVRVRITCLYKGSSKRPYKFRITESVNGGASKDIEFDN
ncbi:MAG: DNA/RNA non-specific endonuclease, partial [Cyclobacteriaceae bacterium]